jgi:hypothetical protein
MICFSPGHQLGLQSTTSHTILVFDSGPPWSGCLEASHKLVHVLLGYTVGIHPVPVPGENIDNILRIPLRATAKELGVSRDTRRQK